VLVRVADSTAPSSPLPTMLRAGIMPPCSASTTASCWL